MPANSRWDLIQRFKGLKCGNEASVYPFCEDELYTPSSFGLLHLLLYNKEQGRKGRCLRFTRLHQSTLQHSNSQQ